MLMVDYAILVIVGLSALLGLIRGMIRDLLSIAGWIAALLAAVFFTDIVAAWLVDWVGSPVIRQAIAFVSLFIGVLLLSAPLVRVVGELVDRSGLSGMDRILGFFFGFLRGVVIVALLVMLSWSTPLPRQPWWEGSALIAYLEYPADQLRRLLPDDLERYFHLPDDLSKAKISHSFPRFPGGINESDGPSSDRGSAGEDRGKESPGADGSLPDSAAEPELQPEEEGSLAI
ncbi:MAG: CvpA family protein [Ectothiorhodospiraceae bacterium AqS1]|nr:CvpA family protein [Ectothiorhodospiraceae bacterium AqS1]